MAIQSFREIIAWQKAHELTLLVYKLTEKYPSKETFGLVSQSRRCAVSIPSNIAEGFKRQTTKDSIHFYNIAEGSLEELKYQLLLAKDLGYINTQQHMTSFALAEEVGKLVNGWKKSQN